MCVLSVCQSSTALETPWMLCNVLGVLFLLLISTKLTVNGTETVHTTYQANVSFSVVFVVGFCLCFRGRKVERLDKETGFSKSE